MLDDRDAKPAIRFRWLDREVTVSADHRSWLGPLWRHWGPGVESVPRQGHLRYSILDDPETGPTLHGPAGVLRLDGDAPALHAYHAICRDLLGRVGDRFVLHATGVTRDGRALVISGPSTFGKTTLGIHLAARGAGWIADDLLLLSRERRTVAPFPRPLRLRPGGRSLLSGAERERARRAVLDREGDDWIVDPTRWFETERVDRPCGWVVILRPASSGDGIRSFPFYRIRLRDGSTAARAALPTSCRVLRDREPLEDGSILVATEDPGALRAWADEHDEDLMFLLKYPSGSADFDARPGLRPISRFQAAVELAQELQNRHTGSLLAREFAGREIECVLDLAAALGDARTFALTPGDLDTTLELLEAMMSEGVPRPSPRRSIDRGTDAAPTSPTETEGGTP